MKDRETQLWEGIFELVKQLEIEYLTQNKDLKVAREIIYERLLGASIQTYLRAVFPKVQRIDPQEAILVWKAAIKRYSLLVDFQVPYFFERLGFITEKELEAELARLEMQTDAALDAADPANKIPC